MKLKNIGTKIVHVGTVALMPGDEKSFPESAVNTPAIQVLCIKGMLSISDEPVQEDKKAEEVPEEIPAEDPKTTASTGKRSSKGKKTAE